ncbi:MAG: GNAT family N-acetyltransferase [SAR202 cluster bacterium]|nr:GNAT family N-acetyltransferase [SAR202 cluster bacterium]
MRIDVLDATADSKEWEDTLSAFPSNCQDIYLTAAYHQLQQSNGDGAGRLFIVEHGAERLLYPFLIRDVPSVGDVGGPEQLQDIETVYGYSGPVATTTEPEFLCRSWDAFHQWCEEKNVVSEFLRFNPLIANHRYAGESCRLILDRETVTIDLDVSPEVLWRQYPSGQRNKVQKAENSGLTCEEVSLADGLERFRQMYRATMQRLNAARYYKFSEAYFENLGTLLAKNIKLFEVRKEEQLLAAGLFLNYDDRLHYHLGASDSQQWQERPNNLLFHSVSLWGIERGFKTLHLGGGRTPAVDDGLLKFKSSLSKLRAPFYLGVRIHDQTTYDSLCDSWLRASRVSKKPAYFQMYRLPLVGDVFEG